MARKKIVDEVMTEEIKTENVKEVEEVKSEAAAPTKLTGVVVKCDSLNVRKSASPTADIVGRLMKGAQVEISTLDSTGNYYAVSTGPKFSGFCLKDYIEVK